MELIRLQKYLANCGICSRRKAEEFILSGRVKINDLVVRELGTKINPEVDKVLFDNKPVKLENKKIYILLNKPINCVTTAKDQFNRKTVLDYIDKNKIKERLVPVGRLDYESCGLLLLTNDGDLTYKLTHPKHNINKKYIVKVSKIPSDKQLEKFRTGILIDGYKTAPAQIRILRADKQTSTLEIIISEGKNRQIRKMCETLGHEVLELKRVAIEKILLGNLQDGEYRHLKKDELAYLKKLANN